MIYSRLHIERLFITKDSQGVFTYTKDRKVYNEEVG